MIRYRRRRLLSSTALLAVVLGTTPGGGGGGGILAEQQHHWSDISSSNHRVVTSKKPKLHVPFWERMRLKMDVRKGAGGKSPLFGHRGAGAGAGPASSEEEATTKSDAAGSSGGGGGIDPSQGSSVSEEAKKKSSSDPNLSGSGKATVAGEAERRTDAGAGAGADEKSESGEEDGVDPKVGSPPADTAGSADGKAGAAETTTREPSSLTAPRTNNPSSDTITAAIALAIRKCLTPERCVRVISIVGAYYLTKTILRGLNDVIDELCDDSAMSREEHDMPLFSADIITESSESAGDGTNSAGADGGTATARSPTNQGGGGYPMQPQPSPKRPAALSPKHRHVRDMILKLHAAGFPLESQVRQAQQQAQSGGNTGTIPPSHTKTAEAVLASLTKGEGQVLANCLLTPDSLAASLGGGGNSGSNNPWNSIGGLSEVKEALLDLVYPLLAPRRRQGGSSNNAAFGFGHIHSYYGGLLSHPPGVLLFGPPGCGKTMLARALASSAGARFLCVTPSSILRKFVGETNLNVRHMFSLARKVQPCIIFVDEMDGLFRERQSSGGQGHEEHDVSRDLKTEFMQLWDGIESNRDSDDPDRVLVMGATNRPFDVDAAFLRRMPRSYFVGLPDFAARVSILQVMLAGVPLSPDFDVQLIARETEGYSPSDLKEILRTAALYPLREARADATQMASQQRQQQPAPSPALPPLRPLTTADVLRSRQRVAPTQYSSAYRSALADYASRSSGSSFFPQDDTLTSRSLGGRHTDDPYLFGGNGSFDHQQLGNDDGVSSDMDMSSDDDEDSISSDYDDDEGFL